jgi:outer membrane protein assembly factor BamB
MPGRVFLIAITCLGLAAVVGGPVLDEAVADECLRPPRAGAPGGGSLADLGERALERLPGEYLIVRANLSAERPRNVAACYLMAEDLLVVEETGLVYCLSRRDLTARWVSNLRAALHRPPSEGPTHYAFLVKAPDGAYWLHAFDKRNGAETADFPARLPFAASSGISNDGSRIYVGSLGSPGDNRTVESVNLASGRVSWGWRTRGLVLGGPVVDPAGTNLVAIGEDGTAVCLPIGGQYVDTPNWVRRLTGRVTSTPVVTPDHVIVGSHDGILRSLSLATGEVAWLEGIDGPIRTSPWVIGAMEAETRSAGVEGAPDITLERYKGIAFARNLDGLHAFDLTTGARLFQDKNARRPVCKTGKWVVTADTGRTLVFRDSTAGYEVKGRLPLAMFDLIPTNPYDGAIYGLTHDGGVVAAIPRR